jgi:hypothetical protein
VQVDESLLKSLHLSPVMMGPSRANGLANMLDTIKRRTRALVKDLPRFPSLRITAGELTPQGTFAEAQAQYLQPDQQQVRCACLEKTCAVCCIVAVACCCCLLLLLLLLWYGVLRCSIICSTAVTCSLNYTVQPRNLHRLKSWFCRHCYHRRSASTAADTQWQTC